MKHLFEKESNTGLIVLAVAGAVTAGVLAYLFLTEDGEKVRESIRRDLRSHAKDLASDLISHKTGLKKRTVRKAADHVA
jgi:hypothetical protein